MSKLTSLFAALLVVASATLAAIPVLAQDDATAEVQNDEGGPVIIEGEMNYTNPLLALGVAQPLIVLEDQAGFVDRDRGFLMPPESQTLGVITGDFFEPPFGWTLALPTVPQGTLRDVDNDGEEDQGVMTFAVAYWTNIFGDPYLERRDLQGGGWSTAFATTRVKDNPSGKGEVIGGKYIVWAPDDQQGFPSGFGADGLLFTEDDPIVILPQGYTIVDLDTDPFTFDRSARPQMELIEPESFALDDFSGLSYTDAFDAMVAKMRNEYAFTEYKNIDWDALTAEFRPRFEEAEANRDSTAYVRALRDFTWAIPDGHIGRPFVQEDFVAATAGGLGMAIRELDDGRTIVNYVTPEGPAAAAGIELGAQILEMGGMPVADYVRSIQAFSAPFSTEHFERLQQLRYASRYPLGEQIEVAFQNPGGEAQTTTLTAVEESDSFRFSSFFRGLTGAELPVDFELLDSGLGLVRIYSFSDNELLTVQLWEQMITALNDLGIPGLIIDMRQNAGGSGFLADQMAAYFFNDELELGNTGFYDEEQGEFVFDERTIDRFYPPDESLRYPGRVAVIVGPNCNSACEFFSYDMTRQGRADIVGSYPTGGLGGSIGVFNMPDMQMLQFTVGRAVDMNGDIHIEGKGVPPTVDVPVSEETLFYEGDVLLDSAIALLTEQPLPFGAADDAGAAVQPDDAADAAATEDATAAATEAATAEATTEATAEATAEATEAAAEATPEATVESAAPTAELAVGQSVSIVSTSGRVRVYTQPGGAGQIRGFVTSGTTWEVLEVSEDGQWVRINFRGTNPGGWVSASSVQVNN